MKTIIMTTGVKPTGADLFDKVKSSSSCGCETKKNTCNCGCQIKKEVMKTIIKGSVINSDKKPLERVNIVNLSNKKGVSTDVNGYFELEANPDDIIQLSHVSYDKIDLPASMLTFPIIMTTGNNVLDEVVIEAKKSIKNNTWLWVSGGLLAMYAYAKSKKTPKKTTPLRVNG